MLIGIYMEEGNDVRAQALLEEISARAAQKDESLRTYFAMAGQTINGVRSHLARYRTFGINPSDTDLPVEANTDLERVRSVLERVASQAKEIGNEAGRSYDAVALQEDVVGIRLSLPRDDADRDKWQNEYVAVRERLAGSQAQVTSIGRSTLLDAVTSRVPNPFATKPSATTDAAGNDANKPSTSLTSTATTETREPQLISTGSLNGRESKRVTPAYPTVAKNAELPAPFACLPSSTRTERFGSLTRKVHAASQSRGGRCKRLDIPTHSCKRQAREGRRLPRF
jgi:hypothetical protein